MPDFNPFTSRESTIRRDLEGRWFHDGDPVENAAVARAFDRWVDLAEDGRYILRNEVNWVYVEIEGAPVIVVGAQLVSDGVELELSDGRTERLEPDTLRQSREGVLFTSVRDGRLSASFSRHAQLALEPLVEEDDDGVYLALGGRKVRPPLVDDPLGQPSMR